MTWQYWIRRVKESEISSKDDGGAAGQDDSASTKGRAQSRQRSGSFSLAETGGTRTKKTLPCRIHAKVSGVEVFLYNRSPAYDAILENFLGTSSGNELPKDSGAQKKSSGLGNGAMKDGHGQDGIDSSNTPDRDQTGSSGTVEVASSTTIPFWAYLLPMSIESKKGAVVVGNEFTKSVLTTQFSRAQGDVDVARSNPFDLYKLLFNFEFSQLVAQLSPNADFKEHGQKESSGPEDDAGVEASPKQKRKHRNRWHQLSRFWRRIPGILLPRFRSSVESFSPTSRGDMADSSNRDGSGVPGYGRWQGLTRYLDESQRNEHDEWESVEYARSSTILDCPSISITYYWDVPGLVMSMTELEKQSPVLNTKSIPAPDYGLNIQVHGGNVVYGPWADRQRVNMQSVFFPATFTNARPASTLKPGMQRAPTVFKVFLSLEDAVVLRIPIREASKDCNWKGRARAVSGQAKDGSETGKRGVRNRKKSMWSRKSDKHATGPNIRPFAWLDVKMTSNTTITYSMAMVASPEGYQNDLHIAIPKTEVSSSVNHGMLWRSGQISVKGDLSYPCEWNSLRVWTFSTLFNDMEVFVLRDHLFLLTDLVADWGSGPSSDFYTFTPFRYILELRLQDFKLFLNINDSNVVNNPSDLEDNSFLTLHWRDLEGKVCIPLENFSPIRNEVSFEVKGDNCDLELSLSTKNTLKSHLRSKTIGQVEEVRVSGSYAYFTETSTQLTNVLTLNITGSQAVLCLHGFVVRYLIIAKENYFGDDLHFKTLEELQGAPRSDTHAKGVLEEEGEGPTRTNDLDVLICVSVEEAIVLLPCNLYSADRSIRVQIPAADVDLRIGNYYMDLMVDFYPLSLSMGDLSVRDYASAQPNPTEAFVGKVGICGHRLFGLPPAEPTYDCIWDIQIGDISGECSIEFFERVSAAARAFAFSLDDDENAVVLVEHPPVKDVTFLRLRTGPTSLWLRVAQTAWHLQASPIRVDFNDWAGENFSTRLNIAVPGLGLAFLEPELPLRRSSQADEKNAAVMHAAVNTSVRLDVVTRKREFKAERAKQQEHILEHDQRTNRVPFLLLDDLQASAIQGLKQKQAPELPAMPFPSVPPPVKAFKTKTPSMSSTATSAAFSFGRSSFLSSSYSVKATVHRASAQRLPQVSIPKDNFRRKSESSISYVDVAATHIHGEQFSGPPRSGSASQTLAAAQEGDPASLPPSSTFQYSPLATPLFPLEFLRLEPPMALFNSESVHVPDSTGDAPAELADMPTRASDEGVAYTSVFVGLLSGLWVYCSPPAIRSVVHIIDSLLPKDPEDILDSFQQTVTKRIMSDKEEGESGRACMELAIRLPLGRIYMDVGPKTFDGHSQIQDQGRFEVALDQLSLALRKRSPKRQEDTPEMTLHLASRNLRMTIRKRQNDIAAGTPLTEIRIAEVLIWLMSSTTHCIHTSIGEMQTDVMSRKAEDTVKLMLLTRHFFEEIAASMKALSDRQRRKLHFLAYYLTTSAKRVQNPPFLTRPSYALRANTDHIRTHDSWKIISRLRYVFEILSDVQRNELALHCAKPCPDSPDNAESAVIKSWDQWRSWDHARTERIFAVQVLYGSQKSKQASKEISSSFEITLRLADIALVLDPGPQQNEVSVSAVTVALAARPAQALSGLMLMEHDHLQQCITLHLSASSIVVRLNWDLVNVIENVARILTDKTVEDLFALKKADVRNGTSRTDDEKKNIKIKFESIIAAETVQLYLDTVNLSNVLALEELHCAMLWSQNFLASSLLSIRSAAAELWSEGRLLGQARLTGTNFYVAHDLQAQSPGVQPFSRIATACESFSSMLEEETLGLVQVIDRILSDEVIDIKKLRDGLAHRMTNKKRQPTPRKQLRLPRVDLAFALHDYRLDFALVHSLIYSIGGQEVRVAVTPRESQSATFQIDFELKKQGHKLYKNEFDPPTVISLLTLPPVDGRLKLSYTQTQLSLALVTAMERITFDASAIYGILSTFQTPAVSDAFEEVVEDVTRLSNRFKKLGSRSSGQSASIPESRGIVVSYDLCCALQGFSIIANAPATLPDSYASRLAFEISCIKANIASPANGDRHKLRLPSVSVLLRRIELSLKLSRNGNYHRCGNITFAISLGCSSKPNAAGKEVQNYQVICSGLDVNVHAETAASIVNLVNYLQQRITDLGITRHATYLRRLRQSQKENQLRRRSSSGQQEKDKKSLSKRWLSGSFHLKLKDTRLAWIVGNSVTANNGRELHDLVLSLRSVDVSSDTEDRAKLAIVNLQLQMVQPSHPTHHRSANSAYLPEINFNVAHASTAENRRLAFQAAGKSLDIQVESDFVLPLNVIMQSINVANTKFRITSEFWKSKLANASAPKANLFGNKRLSSLLIDADFAGATVHMQPNQRKNYSSEILNAYRSDRIAARDPKNQALSEPFNPNTSLRAPGFALKLEFEDQGLEPSLNAELQVSSSSNTLHPIVVPLLLDLSNSIKAIMRDSDNTQEPKSAPKESEEISAMKAEAGNLLGKTKLNLGLRICKQEFSLSCQPIARVVATAQLEDIYVTFNSVTLTEHDRCFAVAAIFESFSTSIQHVYSKESTFQLDIASVVLSIINRKHLDDINGVSAMLKINPVQVQVNAKQIQNFLIFREIWMPPEMRQKSKPVVIPSAETEEYLVNRYRQVAAAAAFAWDVSVSVPEITTNIELGQAIGRMTMKISNLWASSEKASDWEQNLCVGIGEIHIEGFGRMSGFIRLQDFKVRTAISWPQDAAETRQTPVIQASIGFGRFRTKAIFDFQAFAVGDITSLHFLMYNLRDTDKRDRLAASMDADKVCIFVTAYSAAQAAALYQAFERLVQDNKATFSQSLTELNSLLRRQSGGGLTSSSSAQPNAKKEKELTDTPTLLHNRVLVTLRSLNVGAFPGSLFDNQALIFEASDTQARFYVVMQDSKVHSGLGMTLGQLRVALAPLSPLERSKSPDSLTVEDVIQRATSSRAGTILRVPRAVANMQTWQTPGAYQVEYIFRSSFEGKIDVGWNYSRISFMRGMWNNHSRALSARLGKPMPESAVKITTEGPDDKNTSSAPGEQEKITAVVTMPQSRYDYRAREPPIIETPQLRDMGEATPPLEWIGLNRDRMPNITHQIVIVPLLEVAKEVEDAYARILGSS